MRWTGAYPRWWVCPLKIALHQGGPILPSFQDDSCIHKKSFHSLPLRDALSFPGMWSLMLARAHSAGGYVAERKEKLQTAGVWDLVESHTLNTSSSKTHCLFQVHLKRAFLGPVSCHTSHRCSPLRMVAILFDERNGIQKLISPVCELSEMFGCLGSPVP